VRKRKFLPFSQFSLKRFEMVKLKAVNYPKTFDLWNQGNLIKFINGIAEVNEKIAKKITQNHKYQIIKEPRARKTKDR